MHVPPSLRQIVTASIAFSFADILIAMQTGREVASGASRRIDPRSLALREARSRALASRGRSACEKRPLDGN